MAVERLSQWLLLHQQHVHVLHLLLHSSSACMHSRLQQLGITYNMLHRAHVLMPVTTETNVAVYKTGCPGLPSTASLDVMPQAVAAAAT